MSDTIVFSEKSARAFTQAYNKAVKEGAKEFTFTGHEYIIDYAYYMIEYLVMRKMLNGSFNERKIFLFGR